MSVSSDKALNGNSNTAQTFLTAFVVNAALLAVQVGAFIVLKRRLGRIYSPRTYLPPPDKRAQELPGGAWKWLPALLHSPTEDIIHKNGLDAYMFLRFLKMLMYIFLVFTFFTSIVLFPVDAVNVKSVRTGLDRITWSNITDPADQKRFSAHIILAYLLTFVVVYIIRREMLHFVHMRHQFLISKSHSRLAQARTVLITAVPDELANEHDLRQFASFVPGGVDKVWIYRDTKKLNEDFEERQKACSKLEAASAELLKQATKAWNLKQAQRAKARKHQIKDAEKPETESNEVLTAPEASHEFMNELVPYEKRPKHRTGFLGLFGKKVDTIDWCKDEIARLNGNIKTGREHIVKGKFLGSAFIRCNLQMGAHVLAQCVSYHEPLTMYDKWIEANPKDIVWANLDDSAVEMRTRYITSWLATLALIIAWAFPAAFIGTLSNLDDLCVKVTWLRWVCTAPHPIPGLIQGVLPPALLAILFALLPFILRGLAWYECIPRYSLISVSVYRRYYLFLLIHGFLIVTVTSGITSAIEEIIQEPTQTVQELAGRLPGASVFFLTYMVTQGLSGAGSALIQLVSLVLHYIRKWFLGRTPRQAYGVTFLMPSADFGVILPRLSLLATIALAYSIISPLINALALMSFAMFYVAWKFQLTQVFDQPDESETGGLYFPMAVSNLFVGLYIEQGCLACLFFLKVSVSRTSSIIEGCLMLALFAFTIFAQNIIHNSFAPITNYLPMSLATKKMAKRYERERARRTGIVQEVGEDIDLFSRDRIRSVRKRVQATTKRLDDAVGDLALRVGVPRPSDVRRPSDVTREGGGSPELARASSHDSHASKVSKASKASKMSLASKTSKASSKSRDRKPTFDPPAPAGTDLSDEDSEAEEDALDEHAFDHPSTYQEQSWIWIPRDTLRLSEVLVADLKGVGVDCSDLGAVMDDRGVVEVTRNPPDEEWVGGHDR